MVLLLDGNSNTLLNREGKQVFSENTTVDVIKCLEKTYLSIFHFYICFILLFDCRTNIQNLFLAEISMKMYKTSFGQQILRVKIDFSEILNFELTDRIRFLKSGLLSGIFFRIPDSDPAKTSGSATHQSRNCMAHIINRSRAVAIIELSPESSARFLC